jgi:thiosulfate/3-mercaptopyruvate sulfurtransferase
MNNLMKKILLNAKEAKEFLCVAKSPRILNCSVTRPVFDCEKDSIYIKERLPKSTFFDIDFVCDKSSPFPHMLPSLEKFKEFMQMLDISKNDDIILYDDFSILGAARVYYTFQVFGKNTVILNGGSKAWKAEGFEMETDQQHYKGSRNLKSKDVDFIFRGELVKNMNQVNEFSKKLQENKNSGYLLDARSDARFNGEAPEPRPGLRLGHIPGSQCLFFKKLLNEDFSMKNPDELKQVFENEKISLDKHIMLTCGSGVTAAVEYLALTLCGKNDNISLYDGSWSEYGSYPEAK